MRPELAVEKEREKREDLTAEGEKRGEKGEEQESQLNGYSSGQQQQLRKKGPNYHFFSSGAAGIYLFLKRWALLHTQG